MPLLIVIAFLALELWSIIALGGWIGTLPVLALLGVGLFGGVALIRRAGMGALAQAARAMERAEDPKGPMLAGVAALAAGLLLVVPGFFSDAVALALLIPAAREGLFSAAARNFRGNIHVARYAERAAPQDDVIDVEYREIDPPR